MDTEIKEFWIERAAEIVRKGENLSAYERNRTFLNVGGKDFLDISYLSGTDSDGDGRAVVAADFRNNGQLDLVVRQVGGGPFLMFENRFPKKNYLKVSLRGSRSNRLGIGARLKATCGDLTQVRDNFPVNSYQSQAPTIVHFGLGSFTTVPRLEVVWPSGHKQVFTDVVANRHIRIDESKQGKAAINVVVPGKVMAP